MTDTEIRIAIAEACGWEWRPDPHIQHPAKLRWWIAPHMKDLPGCGVGTSEGECPDYLNDLNAVHEAENTLDNSTQNGIGQTQWHRYRDNLVNVTGNSFPINATAHQRAEAFLRTLGKWKD